METVVEALVTPKCTPWIDGPSDIDPLPAGTKMTDVSLANYPEGDVTVNKAAFPGGHVLIVAANRPTTAQAVLPMIETTANSCIVMGLGKHPFYHGVVVRFVNP